MSVPTCNHLKEDGVYCGSPALNGRQFCYFHLNLRARRLKLAQARRRGSAPALDLPFPEDMHAVQLGLAEVMWALSEDRIETKKAWALLSSLQFASANLIRTPNWHGQREAVPERRPLRALTDPGFERRHGLPKDVDLSADPVVPDSQTPSHPETQRTEPSALESKDPLLACHPERSRPPLAAESKDPFPANQAAGAASVPDGAAPPATSHQPLSTPPDRVPFPEDVLAQLKMTKIEEIEFFVHKCQYAELTDEQEHALLIHWLRQRRAEEAADPALAAQRRQDNDQIVAHLAEARRNEEQASEAA